MNTTSLKKITLVGTILITLLFYKQSNGLNVLIFESLVVLYFWFSNRITKNTFSVFSSIALVVSSIFTIITYSGFVYVMNVIALLLFVGVHLNVQAKSIVSSLGLGLMNAFEGQKAFFISLRNSRFQSIGTYVWKFRIFLLPSIIIGIFVLIYSNSNPLFDKIVSTINKYIGNWFGLFFENIEFSLVITFVVGLLISNFILQQTKNDLILDYDAHSDSALQRVKSKEKRSFKAIGLKNELRSAIFLFISLNALLLVLNILDIYFVWFNFEWANEALKDFVHEGTYYLIFSILLSIILVLYFFRGNLNFFNKNKILKVLCYAWLTQNALLTVSVIIRTYWYVHYFSLAHKRIGLLIFLLLTLYGLYTVFVKVKERKSAFFLFKNNVLAIFTLLLISSFVNWDKVIAKYNVSHAGRSYYEMQYMSQLSYATLPIVDLSMDKLERIKQYQFNKYPLERIDITPSEYIQRIEMKKNKFKSEWEQKSWLSWNLSEYLTYMELVEESVVSDQQ
ncbi:MAG TPA: DUF4173 domain-containing protein [Cytophaga sp.]|nr:DUF4173 domain-containing protein [Cytophaga sp.]